jgi:hypothetical protein
MKFLTGGFSFRMRLLAAGLPVGVGLGILVIPGSQLKAKASKGLQTKGTRF